MSMPGQDGGIYHAKHGAFLTLDPWAFGDAGVRLRPRGPRAKHSVSRNESHNHRVSRFGRLLDGAEETSNYAWSISSSGPKSRVQNLALPEPTAQKINVSR